MHPLFTKNKDGSRNKERFGIMVENESYFIVTRAGRQIDLIRRAGFPKTGFNREIQHNDRYWVIELDFDPTLDEDFGVTVNKQQITISERMWAILHDQSVGAIAKSLWERAMKLRDDEKTKKAERKQKESENVMVEAERFTRKPVKTPISKIEKAKENILKEAEKKSRETGRPQDELVKELAKEILDRPYRVLFSSRPGAPFFWVERFGAQLRLYINSAHKFYTKLYSAPDSTQRVKSALELVLFALGSCEVDAVDEKELFYQTERTEWSSKLNIALELLDKREPVEDIEAAIASDEELKETASS